MTEKSKIVLALGESAIALPALVNAALAANDRIKYRFSLLQAACAHAEHPGAAHSSLRSERLAAGIDEPALDQVVAQSCPESGGWRVPGAGALFGAMVDELREMIAPFADMHRQAEFAPTADFAPRLAALLPGLPQGEAEVVSGEALLRATSGERGHGDSLHLLVMDAHKALNRLQTWLSAESINGAAVYGLAEADRPRVAAFMQGLARTAPLKFEHPGLATTATRAGDTLLLQNDIGTTDAHVLVIHVRQAEVSVTYTDVHLQRLLFFQGLFAAWAVQWEDARSRADASMEDGVYHLSTGRYRARDEADLCAFLTHLGSRLVFLIDWNRARKQLKLFLPKEEVLDVLRWAADNDYGHMAFLRCGGQQMLLAALSFVAPGASRYGQALHELLGASRARDCLQFVLRTCATNLLAGRAVELVQDEVRAELFGYFRNAEQGVFDLLAEHAALALEIAANLRDAWLQAPLAGCAERFARQAAAARAWEHGADEQVAYIRDAVRHAEGAAFFRQLASCADDVPDELEDAAFHLTLLAAAPVASPVYAPVAALMGHALAGCQEYVKALEACRELRPGAPREDVQDFLEAVHRIVEIEKMADDSLREFKRALVAAAPPAHELYVLDAIAACLESATDALMHTARVLRDQMLDRYAEV